MKLSIIVIFYDMKREAERTLYSLSDRYQEHVDGSDWEVIAIDNGSNDPIGEETVKKYGEHWTYIYNDTNSVSPCAAINNGVRKASARYVAISIDGARMMSPGMLYYMLKSLSLFEHSLVCSLSWHLGPKEQNVAVEEGYDQKLEDQLLERINWADNGYELFSVSSLAPSSGRGFFDGISESGFFALSVSDFWGLGGYEERFAAPGGGRANIDFYKRAVESPKMEVVHLLGEGTFHQVHGGVTTNVPRHMHPRKKNLQEYEAIRGEPYKKPEPKVTFIGHVPPQARRFVFSKNTID